MNGGEVCDDGKESLEDLELYVDTLQHAVVHCLDDRDRREGDDAKSDESLEGAEGNGDNIGIFVERRMKTGRMRLYASHLS